MLLNIYLGSFAVITALTGAFAVSFEKRLKREGYKVVKSNESLTERLFKLITILIRLAIPIYNLIIGLGIVFCYDMLYEDIKEKMLEQGDIYKPIEKDKKEEIVMDQEISKEENINNINKDVKRNYSDLTVEEQLEYLEKEKERLLKIKSNPDIPDGPILRKSYKPNNRDIDN